MQTDAEKDSLICGISVFLRPIKIRLTAEEFERLSAAIFAELENKFGQPKSGT
jgi:hypothetical protein